MKFTLLALTFCSILPQYVSPVLAASNVCSTGIYATLAPLAAYAPAQAFCSAKFPAVIVTVTASVHVPRGKRNPVPATTSSTNAKKSTTTTKPTTTTNSQDPRSSLLSLLSAQAYNIASTFCSCINPPQTVTVQPSTTTATTTPTTTAAATQCTPKTDIPELGDCSDCNTSNCVFSATCATQPYGGSYTTYCADNTNLKLFKRTARTARTARMDEDSGARATMPVELI